MEAEIPTMSVALKNANVMATVWDRGLVHVEKALSCGLRTYPGPWCMTVAARPGVCHPSKGCCTGGR